MDEDVPSPIDLRLMTDAAHWEASALAKRPCRPQFFAASSAAVRALPASTRILELGSGPGFLAQRLLEDHPHISYVALDFSDAMHELAARRLAAFAGRLSFIERSFRESIWSADLGLFGCVVTNQAVHELRHKRHHPALHQAVRRVLTTDGTYLVCDHFFGPGGRSNDRLYMSSAEQRDSLRDAGFSKVEVLLETGGLVLHAAAA
jgi:SAM-dependent methyltransferase